MRSEKSVNVNATIRNVFFPGVPLKDAVALIQAIPMSDRIDLAESIANETPAMIVYQIHYFD